MGQRPLLLATIPAASRRKWWRRSAHQQVIGGRGILLVADVGQDGGETPRTFLDKEGFLPILVQHL
jgi:hypothetical protein